MIVYFSGTGNSRYCAEFLADKLEDRITNAAEYIKNGNSAELASDRSWVFVCPTYAWRIPRVFSEFIRNGAFKGSDRAYFVMTCGSGIGKAGEKLESLCKTVKLRYMGVFRVVMPENYIAMFSAPDQDEAVRIVRKAEPGLGEAAEIIRRGENFPRERTGLFGGVKTGFANDIFYRGFISADKFFVRESCVSCGKCEKNCPLGNIELKNGKPVWGKECTHCMACICGCPAEAIEYGRHSRGKRRYMCGEYKQSGEVSTAG
ncbi:MAG: EFR1 family ferrodoxin [Eubacteriales bacterium]